ncbi:MAG: putative glycosyltransferase EpsE [Lentisphaerae bacterium ADurb.Bin082]|nr:MAG: putative glycosyltransferase EpsE [Lentisphaerae bacterium ADurb.Bin082]
MPYNNPKISVIIPVYNASEFIEERISRVLSQEVPSEFEVILVDDCSTDNSLQLLSRLAENEKRLRVFHQEKNQGPAAARNRGIEESKGDFIAFLDADDYWKPGFLVKTSAFLEAHSDVVCVFTGQEHKTLSYASSIAPKCLLRDNPPTESLVLEDFFAFWHEQGGSPLCSGSLMVRADLLRRIGGQREDFRICEDLEYWCYIALYGKMGFIPEILFVSDGARGADGRVKLTRKQRLARYCPRWKNAMPIQNWASRLTATGLPIISGSSFKFVLGSIASILIYSMIQDGRWSIAYGDFKDYRRWLPQNAVCRLLAPLSIWYPFWCLGCLMLFLRERLK